MRLLKLLDDTPVVPGDVRPAYEHGAQARQILNDAEDDLRDWRPDTEALEEASTSARVTKQNPGSVEGFSQGAIGADGFAARGSEDRDTEYVRDNVRDFPVVTSIPVTRPKDERKERRKDSGTQGISNHEYYLLQQQQQQHLSTEQDETAIDDNTRGERPPSEAPPALPDVQRTGSLGLGGYADGDTQSRQPHEQRETMVGRGFELPEANN